MALSTTQKKKKKDKGADFDSEFWMVTFGDLLSLMLTFFVLLFSMATLDDKMLREIASEFSGGIGALSLSGSSPFEPIHRTEDLKVRPLEMKKLLNLIENESDSSEEKSNIEEAETTLDALLREGATLKSRGPSFVISLPGENLFAPGSAEMSEQLKPALKRLGKVFRFSTTNLVIEGHTDDLPISSQKYPSNWELSAARAANVMKFFLENTLIGPERLMALGYADTKPIVKNLSEKYRMHNRRVDIVIRQAPGL